MGLDIHICTNNDVDSFDYEKGISLHKLHTLSRTFCNLMLQRQDSPSDSEFNKIELISGVKLNSIYNMNEYPDQDFHGYQLEQTNSDEEREKLSLQMEEQRQSFKNNMSSVLNTVASLINALNSISNLAVLVQNPALASPIASAYYDDFQSDLGDGYIGNNLGQDLRNFKRFLEFAKNQGTHTAWFEYG